MASPFDTLDYTEALINHGLRPDHATDQEKSLAIEVTQLRRLLAHGESAHDMTTLRHVQDAKNRVVAAAVAWWREDDEYGKHASELGEAVAQLRRITTTTTERGA